MKLVIQTQFMENYGAHSWNGEGKCPQYWKFKGGETYVVRNLNLAQAEKVRLGGIPTLKKLIEYDEVGAREYIIDWSVVGDDHVECEEWVTPWDLSYNSRDGWVANRFTEADEYWRKGIIGQDESYIMGTAGAREEYESTYIEECPRDFAERSADQDAIAYGVQ